MNDALCPCGWLIVKTEGGEGDGHWVRWACGRCGSYDGAPHPSWARWLWSHFKTTSDGQRYWLEMHETWRRYKDGDLPAINRYLDSVRLRPHYNWASVKNETPRIQVPG